MAILDVVTYYIYGTLTIEAADLLSSILVFLLVWERLRESLSKKLEYLHKDYMSLSSAYKQGFLYFRNWKHDVERIQKDLKTHGSFLGLSLYPTCLNKIDKFLFYFDKIEDGMKTVDTIGKGVSKIYDDRELWYDLLGIKKLESDRLEAYTKTPAFNSYEQTAKTFKEEQAELLKRLKHLIGKTEEMKKELLRELEEFLKSNNLPLEPKYDRTF
jgi:hypothetical protein